MLRPEVQTESSPWNVESAVSSALRPRAMLGRPVARAIMLEAVAPLPAAVPSPTLLLLPTPSLLLGALRGRPIVSLGALLLLLPALRLLLPLRILSTLGQLLLRLRPVSSTLIA